MKFKLLLCALLAIFSLNTFAGVPTVTTYSSNTDTENRAYAGLVWTLQDKMSLMPDLTLGFRSLRVKSTDSVEGADLSARFKLKDGIAFDSTRLVYVGGERDVLGNIGVGYSNTNQSFLGTVAVQGPYSRLGTDFEFTNKKFVPYLELLTLEKPNKTVKKSTTTNIIP